MSEDENRVEEAGAQNLMETLRARREQALEDKEYDLEIPGYNGDLVARYRHLSGKEADQIGTRVMNQTKQRTERTVHMAMDTMIAACTGMYARIGAELVPIDPNGDGIPCGYDEELAQFMGFEATTAREVVRGVFVGNEMAIGAHSMQLQRWMSGDRRTMAEEFLGEA